MATNGAANAEGCMPRPGVCKLCEAVRLLASLAAKAELAITGRIGRRDIGTDAFLRGTSLLCKRRRWTRAPPQSQDLSALED